MKQQLLDALVCPICLGKLELDERNNYLVCVQEALAYPIKNRIPALLKEEAIRLTEDQTTK